MLTTWRLPIAVALLTTATTHVAAVRAAEVQNVAAESADANRAPSIETLKKLGARLTFDEQHRLVGVNLSERRVVDADLAALKQFPDVEELDLTRTKVTNAAAPHLKELKKLRVLYLTDTQVDDAGIAELKTMSSLRFLALSGTKITDAALAPLAELKKLEKLFCLGTKVTAAGAEKLQKALPDCLITN